MNTNHNPQKRLVFGCSGTGKSTLFRTLLQSPGYRYRFVFDHDGMVANKLGWQPAGTIKGLCQLLDSGRPVVFWPGYAYPANTDEAFGLFCLFVVEQCKRLKGKKLFGADELGEYCTTNFWKFPAGFRTMLSYGRNLELDMVLAAQSVTDLAKRGRRQLTEIYSFKHADTDGQAFDELAAIGISPEAVKALPHPSTHGKIGYVYRHCLTGRTEIITHAIKKAA